MTNLVAVLGFALSSRVAWWLDPVVGIVLCVAMVASWMLSAIEQVQGLGEDDADAAPGGAPAGAPGAAPGARTDVSHPVGRTAAPSALNDFVYMAVHHDQRIIEVDKVSTLLVCSFSCCSCSCSDLALILRCWRGTRAHYCMWRWTLCCPWI